MLCHLGAHTTRSKGEYPSAPHLLAAADNRVYDGEVASQFLAAFARHMANPYSLFQ